MAKRRTAHAGRWILGIVLTLLIVAAFVAYRYPLVLAEQQIRYHLWRSGVDSEYASVGGYSIHYFEATPPAGEAGVPLLLVHGLGARGEDWSPLIPGLAAAGFHVYAPDLLGYGRSAHPDVDYSIRMQEQLVTDFMKVLHLDRADVAGWSMGGWVAMKLAADHPALVNRLVLFDAAGVYFPGYTDLAAAFEVRDVQGVRRLFARLTPHPQPIPDFVADHLARRIQANAWVIRRSMAAMVTGRDMMDFRLASIHEPTLVVWGAQDDLIPLSSGEKIHRLIPRSSMLILEGCGHLAPAECSKASLKGIIDFLKTSPTPQGAYQRSNARP